MHLMLKTIVSRNGSVLQGTGDIKSEVAWLMVKVKFWLL